MIVYLMNKDGRFDFSEVSPGGLVYMTRRRCGLWFWEV